MSFINPLEQRHQLLEWCRATTLTSTAGAFIVTLFLFTTGLGAERNPFIKDYIYLAFDGSTTGIALRFSLIAVASLLALAAIFALYRRYIDEYPRLVLGGAAAITLVAVVDVLVNLTVLAWTGVPDVIWFRAIAPPAVITTVTASCLVVRRRHVKAAVELAATARARHGTVFRRSAAVVFSVLLAVSIIGPGVVMLPGVDSDHGGTAAAETLSDIPEQTVFVAGDEGLKQINTDDGSVIWSDDLDGNTGYDLEKGPNGTLYVAGGTNLYAFDQDGTRLWSETSAANPLYGVGVTPDGNHVFTGDGATLRKHDTADGSVLASNTLSWSIKDVHASDVRDRVYVTHVSDGTHTGAQGFAVSDLSNVWTSGVDVEQDSVSDTADGSYVLSTSGDPNYYSRDADNGSNSIVGYTPGGSSPADVVGHPTDDTIFYAVQGAEIAKLSAASDNQYWNYTNPDSSGSRPWANDIRVSEDESRVFAATGSGNVRVLDDSDGSLIYNASVGSTLGGIAVGDVGDAVYGDIVGRAVDQNGDPVANATVFATGIETADPPQIEGRDYDDLADDPLTTDWYEQLDLPGFSKDGIDPSTAEFDETRVLMHRAEQWNLKGWPWPQDGVVSVPNSELDPPQTVVAPEDEPTFSCWDFGASAREKLFEDNFGASLPGAIIDLSCDTIVFERIDPMGDDYLEVSPDPEVRIQQGSASLSNGFTVDYEYTKPELSQGVYKVYAKRQADSPETHMIYTVAPGGDPSNLEMNLENWLENKQEAQTQALKDIQEEYEAGNIELSNTTTNASGYYGLNMPSQVDRVDVVAVKGGPDAQGSAGVSRADVRNEFRNAVVTEFESTSAISWEDADRDRLRETCSVMDSVAGDIGTPYTGQRLGVEPPTNSADIEGVRLIPPTASEDVRYCYAVNLAETIREDGLGGLFPGFQGDPSDLQRAELEERYRTIMGYIEGTPILENALDERADADIDTILNEDPSDLSRGTLESRLNDGVATVERGGDASLGGGGGGIPGSGGSSSPTISPPDSSTGNETLNALWNVGNVDDWDDASLLVRLHYSNGSTTMLNGSSEYVTADESVVGTDTVRLSDYPLGETDPATVRVELDVATPGGSKGDPDTGESVVRNPTFDGEVPSLRDMRVSTLTPGAGDNVSISVTPRESARFGSLKYANVSHSDCSYSVNPDGEELDIWTCGTGSHHVSVTFTNPGGVTFTETFQLEASQAAQHRPATVRSKVGAVGRYAMTNGQLRGGAIETRDGASVVEVIAISTPGQVPSSVIASTTNMDVAKDSDTVVRVVEGDAQQTVRKRVGVLLHRDSPSDEALLYRNDQAVPSDGDSPSARINASNGKLTMDSFTDETGEVTLRVNGDPDFIDRIRHWVSLNVPVLLLGASGDTVLLVTPFVVYYRRRKRPPNTGSGGQEVEA